MTSEDNLAAILKDIEKHLAALVRFNHAQIMREAITNPVEQKVYELTGTKTTKEICSELHLSATTVSELWNKWANLGIVTKQGNSYKKTVE
jgi:predicted transcriptional regulator